VLARALGYPDAEDDDGETLRVSSGQLAIFSAAADGGRLALGAPARCPA